MKPKFGRLIIEQKQDVKDEIWELRSANEHMEKQIDINELRIKELEELMKEWNATHDHKQ